MSNNRVYFAISELAFAKLGSQTFTAAHGVQNCGVTTSYDVQVQQELGQLDPYQLLETVPTVEIAMQKKLDGYPILFHLATNGATINTLPGRGSVQTIVGWTVYGDTGSAASGTPIAEVQCSGAFAASSRFSFPSTGQFTEDLSLVGLNKVWKTSNFAITGGFDNTDSPLALASGLGGVQQRQNFRIIPAAAVSTLDANGSLDATAGAGRFCVFPQDIAGISASGTNDRDANLNFSTHFANVNVNCDFGREGIFELGRRGPYYRFINFPVEITTDFEITATTGDLVSATEAGVNGDGTNLTNRTIKLATDEGLFIDLGTKCKLTNISYNGGDAGGGNLTITYSYKSYNTYVVSHLQDPSGL